MPKEGWKGGAVFIKSQAVSRIHVMVSSSESGTTGITTPKGHGNDAGWNKMQSERDLAFHCVMG